MLGYLLAGAAGLVAMYFLDPDRGRRRRALVRDRAAGTVRRASAAGERVQRRVASDAYGVGRKMSHAGTAEEEPPNDATLAQKVMTELFRDPAIPKGSININAENGVVQLRGQVGRPEEILEIEGRARRVTGVLDVENLLHLPGTPARTS
ncbi:MAG: BON domain-containing protein [Candidatus Limnocylindria bacterium]